ncbi:hypothetical protein L3049_01990 [Labilibaculum sp. DW002]|uniref:Uncharacterized protein n=1 Tax=Paralabilibaculum antarcticum TaxID=2912572 RepID=A0ABT5VNC4_9BACT|nr:MULTISPECIES: hypothetical protein [unclassified Labilibaculum]MBI9058645.1 hypothetical protein [Labilibaculum sp.]MDE5416761.1 hypothetical protein [Labilibaculum sp. DW002]
MKDLSKVEKINKVIEEYLNANSSLTIVPVKELMPAFIKAGIFVKDIKKGLPIRLILRELDASNQLDLIPRVHAERHGEHTYWYFVPASATVPETPYKQEKKKLENDAIAIRLNSDETYVISLCDEVLSLKANRQKRFDFLLGDLHKNGKTQTMLPVDAYYEELQLVIEYKEIQNYRPLAVVDKDEDEEENENTKTLSREEQRRIYDERRAKVLPENEISMIVISYSDFEYDDKNKIKRNKESDLKIVQKALKDFR